LQQSCRSCRAAPVVRHIQREAMRMVLLGEESGKVFVAASPRALQASPACLCGSPFFDRRGNGAFARSEKLLGRLKCQPDIRPQCAGCKNRKEHGHVEKHFCSSAGEPAVFRLCLNFIGEAVRALRKILLLAIPEMSMRMRGNIFAAGPAMFPWSCSA
jgi:hypothetical protein